MIQRREGVQRALPLFLHGCSSVDRARLCEGRGHRFESCQLYQTLFGARPKAGRETLNLEIVVRVHGAEPEQLVSRLMVGLRIPNPLIGVRVVAGQPIHAVAEWLGARLQPSFISVQVRAACPTLPSSSARCRATVLYAVGRWFKSSLGDHTFVAQWIQSTEPLPRVLQVRVLPRVPIAMAV